VEHEGIETQMTLSYNSEERSENIADMRTGSKFPFLLNPYCLTME
jgi:hypothetical protein